MHVTRGTFTIDEIEEVILEGNYDTKIIKNEALPFDELCYIQNISGQIAYYVGNVIYRTDTENIDDLIKLFIRISYEPCNDVDLDTSVKDCKQMQWGTICPTRQVLFAHKSKIFIAYGRYIFGCKNHAIFKCNEREEEITLDTPSYKEFGGDEYVYSFMIIDENTKVMEAFGLYR